jgi:hypothetical protein
MYYLIKTAKAEYKKKKLPKNRFNNIKTGMIYKVYERKCSYAVISENMIFKIKRKKKNGSSNI